jgi:hypothetical protein
MSEHFWGSNKGFEILANIGQDPLSGTAPRQRTLSRAADFDHKWPQELPHFRGLRLVQRTSTTEGLKDLPLVGVLCLAWWTLTTRASGTAPRWRTLSRAANFDL